MGRNEKKTKIKRSDIFKKKTLLQKYAEDDSDEYMDEEMYLCALSKTAEDDDEFELSEAEDELQGAEADDKLEVAETEDDPTTEQHISILNYIDEDNYVNGFLPRDNRGVPDRRKDKGLSYGNGMYDSFDYCDNAWIMKSIVNELLNRYIFISLKEQLYIYESDRGFYRLLPMNSLNRKLRELLPKEMIGRIAKKDLSELYEWLVLNAKHVQEHDLKKNMNYINFADCALNYKTLEIVSQRENLYFFYALSFPYPGKKESSGKFLKFMKKIFKNDGESLNEFGKF